MSNNRTHYNTRTNVCGIYCAANGDSETEYALTSSDVLTLAVLFVIFDDTFHGRNVLLFPIAVVIS